MGPEKVFASLKSFKCFTTASFLILVEISGLKKLENLFAKESEKSKCMFAAERVIKLYRLQDEIKSCYDGVCI